MKGEEREGICEAIGNYKNLFTVPLQTSPTMTTYKNQYFHTSLTFLTRWQHWYQISTKSTEISCNSIKLFNNKLNKITFIFPEQPNLDKMKD